MELSAKDEALRASAPAVFELVKKLDPLLEKHGVAGHIARVGMVLDISISMRGLFSSGAMQELVTRFMPLGHRFDDNGAIDVFLFGVRAHNIGEVSTNDYDGFVQRMLKDYPLEGGTRYDLAIAAVREHYFGSSDPRNTPHKENEPPVYMVFVTDGDTQGKDECIKQLKAASFEPIFWQFIALGADYVPGRQTPEKKFFGGTKMVDDVCPSAFRFLDELDTTVPDRYVDNAGFFAIEPTKISDEDLFGRMMGEYPEWLRYPKVKAMSGAS